jgi:hypothetical protein
MEILQTKYTKPIEREYEAWIINCIEKYFKKIDKQVRIFAVSPALESSFPADEIINYKFKIIGLQFKKTSVSNLTSEQTQTKCSNIHWVLNNPPGQFALVQVMTEIYYCLPTFINRDFKNVALDHCLLWRPHAGMTVGTFWYNNPNARGQNNQNIEASSLRWGQFIEQLYECKIGSIHTPRSITRELIIETILNDNNDESTEGLYALIIEI